MEIANETSAFSDGSKDINTSLHIMAAHLHRYKSELQRVEFILSELLSSKFDTTSAAGEGAAASTSATDRDSLKGEQLISQFNAIVSFADEMERKVQNILTLVSSASSRERSNYRLYR
jgi:hypothetical protein